MKGTVFALASLFALSALALVPSEAKITLVEGNNMPLVEATLDGVKCTLILDTGASHTTFDVGFVTNAFPSAKLSPVELIGRTNVRSGAPCFFGAKKLEVGSMTFDAREAMAFPLGQLNAVVGRRVDGILGMNHLLARPFLLSLAEGRIIWDPPTEARMDFVRAVSTSRDNRRELRVMTPKGETLPLLIDSGSTWTFVEKGLWPEAEREARFSSADVNRRAMESMPYGVRQKVTSGVEFELEPLIAPQRGLNQIGASALKELDVIFDGEEVYLRHVRK